MFLVLAALTAVSEQPTESTPLTADEFSELSMSYFERPRAQLIERAMLFFDRSGWAESSTHQLPSMMTFSCIAHRPEQKARQWTTFLNSLHDPARSLLGTAVSSSPDDLLAKIPSSAQKNDMNWACYFAAGNTKYIKNVLDVAANYGERRDRDLYVAANVHLPKVRRYLQSSESPVAKTVLGTSPEAIVAETKNTLAEQHQKGIW
jgi:hypothetical protein